MTIIFYRQVLLLFESKDKDYNNEIYFPLLSSIVILLSNKLFHIFLLRFFQFYSLKISTKITIQINTLIYDKLLKVSPYAPISEGDLVNFIQLDAEKTRERLFRSQVSPHFIYNALTAIQALPDNPDKTKKAIGDFAKYLRQTLNTINENTLISFEQEFENVQVYLRLEKIRFGKSLQVEYDIEEKDFELPAMSMQILAENAVKHGISVKRDGGTIKITTKREGNDFVIKIIDDGVGFDVNAPRDSTHIGIENVRNRIETMVGGELEIESRIGYGTTATIRFPISK